MAFLVSTVLTKTVLKMIMQSLLWNCQHTVCLPLKRCGVVLGEKAKGFVRKAGTFILAASVVIWLLSYIGPHGINVNINQSFYI